MVARLLLLQCHAPAIEWQHVTMGNAYGCTDATILGGATQIPYGEEPILLTEAEVQRSFRKLVKNSELVEDTFERMEALLDELRPESPLRHRLYNELEELRKLASSKG
jgi:hypothetical protein